MFRVLLTVSGLIKLIKLWLILITPLLVCYFFSLPSEEFSPRLWLLQATTASFFILLLVFLISSYIGQLSRSEWFRPMLNMVLFTPLLIWQLFRVLSFYFQGSSFNDRFFYHLSWDTLLESINYPWLLTLACLYLLLGCYLIHCLPSSLVVKKIKILLPLLFLSVSIDPDLNEGTKILWQRYVGQDEIILADVDWEKLGLNPQTLANLDDPLKPEKPGKNLVLIYLESLEAIYLEENIFPGLTPRINKLRQEGLYFSGINSTPGTTWTVAGIVSSQCGTPLLFDAVLDGNDVLHNGYLEKANCLGDVLNSLNYHQIFLGGASLGFAGKGHFLQQHGYNDVLGYEELSTYLENPSYRNNWGLFDDSLFAEAKKQWDILSTGSQPFNLTLLTVDTHHPSGWPSATCQPYSENSNGILQAVHCTDQLVGQFIEDLRQSVVFENTVVALMSDHLAMRNTAQDYYPSDYERRPFMLILNSVETGELTYESSHMDIAPTLLHTMNINPLPPFLAGRDLLSLASEKKLDGNLPIKPAYLEQDRLSLITRLNREMLSTNSKNICSDRETVKVVDGQLFVGGQQVLISMNGYPIRLQELSEDRSLLVFLDNQGHILGSKIEPTANLSFLLGSRPNQSALVFSAGAGLQHLAGPKELPFVGLYYINSSLELTLIDTVFDTEQFVSGQHCRFLESLLKEESESLPIESFCPQWATLASADPYIVQSSSNLEDLQFNQVSTGFNWFKGSLVRIKSSGELSSTKLNEADYAPVYELASLSLFASYKELPPTSRCHPWFRGGLLLVPFVNSPEGAMALLFERDKQVNTRFHLREAKKL